MDCYASAGSQMQHLNLLEEYQQLIVVTEVYRLKLMVLLLVWTLYRGTSHGDLFGHVIYFSSTDEQ